MSSTTKTPIVPKNILFPFILLATCFAMWGLSNNMTDPLVKAFLNIFPELSTAQTALIQNAFYGAYFVLAIPGAVLARVYGYKKGVLVGLGVYILGGLLFYPASLMLQFEPFLLAFFVLAGGLSILETNANPYIISMGPAETATRRLNLAQSFNPVGSLIGLFLCKFAILTKLEVVNARISDDMPVEEVKAIQVEQLDIVMTPYFIAALVLIILWVLIATNKNMPTIKEHDHKAHVGDTVKFLLSKKNYVFAVVAQFFYVGAQIAVWTYSFHYITGQLNIPDSEAMNYHMIAIILFSVSRWGFTALMAIFKPSTLLAFASVMGIICSLGVIFGGEITFQGYIPFVGAAPFTLGIACLIATSVFMSLMFPTIFGLGSRDLGEATKLGASGLIMAILGGALLVGVQGKLIDVFGGEEMMGIAAAKSYVVPLVCFIVIASYAFYAVRNDKTKPAEA
ncbi:MULTISPECIES: L-fucose:H+ symporter permease [unclassified Lentimonas]|uniref:L-fucose:H+ symporter permease n=1 Tax=unclassified Lentimonas TaxID=2630993 RepID=UPI0013219488|nr:MULTISPECIES: L-fucose:H+ symporter permease [unclassified Lentimonas]CAA6677181.1 Fucose permease [Lentimonas sp. CC4]CAA6686193.1 Fucose permease [Lentimonas sp. CC6]CAA6695400.1 Fucose permease [Lentimonas sp. CC10]CAA6695809.1 Fucose permease [Lentimonas sp. CC19]CAA7072045.1 Fucose permease [Lentimonas sp. CC11]